MDKKKLGLLSLVLLVLPPAFLETLNNIYNIYVPIYIQAGSAEFSASGTLTLGFGFGAMLVGIWMVADNLFAFFAVPITGAWSDRTKNKRGRRVPFIFWTLPLIVIGYALIPYIPTLIPQDLNGQHSQLVLFFIAFTLGCIIFYLGATPVRVIFQTIRQESVEVNNRVKVESWYNFIMNIFTILAYTTGSILYVIYGPLLFWVVLALYVITALIVAFTYKESEDLSESANEQESTNMKQLSAVFKEAPKKTRINFIWFLVSVFIFTISASAYTNFASSWTVKVLGVNEATASMVLAIIIIASCVVVLPAGYIAAGKFGRRNIYIVGMLVMTTADLLLMIAPNLYMVGFILLGIGVGIGFPSQLPLATEIAPQKGKLGSVLGVYNLAYMTGFVSGSFVAGWIIQATSYNSLFFICVVAMAISLGCFMMVKPAHKVEEASAESVPQSAN